MWELKHFIVPQCGTNYFESWQKSSYGNDLTFSLKLCLKVTWSCCKLCRVACLMSAGEKWRLFVLQRLSFTISWACPSSTSEGKAESCWRSEGNPYSECTKSTVTHAHNAFYAHSQVRGSLDWLGSNGQKCMFPYFWTCDKPLWAAFVAAEAFCGCKFKSNFVYRSALHYRFGSSKCCT